MKPVLKFVVFFLLTGTLLNISCKKEKPTADVTNSPIRHSNRPPVANAGQDQTLTLATDVTSLDGKASTDPDNNITSYEWVKISGPSSFFLANSRAVQTQLKSITIGTYQFELTVTDAGGLFSKDTVSISMNVTNGLLNVTGCNAAILSFGRLSRPASISRVMAAGTKIFFGTFSNGPALTEIYDTITHAWSTSNEIFGDINIGNKLLSSYYNYPINTQIFDVYDAVTNSKVSHRVPGARAFIQHTIAENKVIFSGGSIPDSPYTSISKRVDIYDNSTNSWSLINFEGARAGMSVVGFGDQIFFAGGAVVKYDSLFLSCDDDGTNCSYYPATVGSKRIDIYNLTSHTWSAMELITPRISPVTAVVGNKILFAGGGAIDVYDASNNTWTVITVTPETFRARAHTVGNKVLFPGLQTVGIYDAALNSWSTVHMSKPNMQSNYRFAIAGNKIVFFLVFDWENDSKNIDIYDASANTWCHAVLNRGTLGTGIIGVGNRIYLAGGLIRGNPSGVYDTNIDDVSIFNF